MRVAPGIRAAVGQFDDMPAHIRTALTTTSMGLSIDRGQLVLGAWQAVYLWEHRARAHQRQLSLHLIGE